MVQEEYKVIVIKPNEGCKLTQATDVAIENRVISDAVYLAVNDVADNWKEITEKEANAIIEEKKKVAEQKKHREQNA